MSEMNTFGSVVSFMYESKLFIVSALRVSVNGQFVDGCIIKTPLWSEDARRLALVSPIWYVACGPPHYGSR